MPNGVPKSEIVALDNLFQDCDLYQSSKVFQNDLRISHILILRHCLSSVKISLFAKN